MNRARLYVGSAERMNHLRDGEVALTVTSPPYWNAIDYDRFTADPTSDYKTRRYAKGFRSYEEFLGLMSRVFAEILRVTRPGGFCAVVVGMILHNRAMIPVPFDLTREATKAGWVFHQDIIWHKTVPVGRRGGTLIRFPRSGNYYPNIVCEYVLVFRKSGDRTAGHDRAHRIALDTLYPVEIAHNVWHIRPVPHRRLAHPCPFPAELPHRLIELYSEPGDLVLDPFVGSGQTAVVARALGRGCVGYDLEPVFVGLARSRLAEPYTRGPQLVAKYQPVEPGTPMTNKNRRAA